MLVIVFFAAAMAVLRDPAPLWRGFRDQQQLWDWMYNEPWFWLEVVAAAGIGARIALRRHRLPAAVFTYAVLSGIVAAEWPDAYRALPALHVDEIHMSALSSVIALLLLVGTVSAISKRHHPTVESVFGLFGLATATVTIMQRSLGMAPEALGGLLGNPSINGALIALTYPINVRWAISPHHAARFNIEYDPDDDEMILLARFGAVAAPVVAVLLSGHAQPVAIMAIVVIAIILHAQHKLYARLPSHAVVTAVIIAAAAAVAIPMTSLKHARSAFDSSGRFKVYAQVLPDWWAKGKRWTGQGTGTTAAIVPKIQAMAERSGREPGEKFQVEEYPMLHSDWLQITFENGIAGLVLSLALAAHALRRAWRQYGTIFASLVGLAAAMVFNWPLHSPPIALLAVFYLSVIYPDKTGDPA